MIPIRKLLLASIAVIIPIAAHAGDAAMSGDGTLDANSALTITKIGGVSISLGGTFTLSGGSALTFTTTGPTNVTFPTSGVLATQANLFASLPAIATTVPITGTGNAGGVQAATGSLVLPNGTSATTQTSSDSTTKLATTAFVQAVLAASGGGVTTLSVASTNGFGGTVANPTTTPVITLTTSLTGLLKGNGTGLVLAVAGTDYLSPSGNGSALTGLTNSQVTGSAPTASPTFTGTVTVPTPTAGDNTTKAASTAFVAAAVAAGGGSSGPVAPQIVTTGSAGTISVAHSGTAIATVTPFAWTLPTAPAVGYTVTVPDFIGAQTVTPPSGVSVNGTANAVTNLTANSARNFTYLSASLGWAIN